MQKNFTDTYIKSLKPTSVRYEEFRDGGFGIRVTPKGVKHGYIVIRLIASNISLPLVIIPR